MADIQENRNNMRKIQNDVYTKNFRCLKMSRRIVRKKEEKEEEPELYELEEDNEEESSLGDSDDSESEEEVTLNILERQPRITAGTPT